VRAAGGVMGRAREGFGAGAGMACDCPLAPAPPSPAPPGQGAAIDAHRDAATALTTDAARLAQQDTAADTQLAAAAAQTHTGRRRMDAVIAAAISDVEAMGLSTGTPQGKAALIEAIERRLRDTKATVGEGTADAGTHAAASEATAAGFAPLSAPTTAPRLYVPGLEKTTVPPGASNSATAPAASRMGASPGTRSP